MKKLMFVALAVASCSAFAAEEPKAINSTVADLQFAKKALAYATKSYSIKFNEETEEAAKAYVEKEFKAQVEKIVKACKYDIDYAIPEFSYTWKTDYSGKTKGTFKFTAPALDKNDAAKTKVVTTKLNGVMVITNPEQKDAIFQTVLWDNTKNPNKPYKYWGVPVDAYIPENGCVKTDDLKSSLNIVMGDGEAHTLMGVATGTVDKGNKKIKSVAGNFTDLACRGYGTWKYANNKKLFGKTLAQVLASKKVELVQD